MESCIQLPTLQIDRQQIISTDNRVSKTCFKATADLSQGSVFCCSHVPQWHYCSVLGRVIKVPEPCQRDTSPAPAPAELEQRVSTCVLSPWHSHPALEISSCPGNRIERSRFSPGTPESNATPAQCGLGDRVDGSHLRKAFIISCSPSKYKMNSCCTAQREVTRRF